jgi:Ca2+-binding EF-hand superfamily protein
MAGNMPAFADFDLNGDGKLSQEEFTEARNRRIGSRAQEGRPMRGLSQAEPFEAIDADGDGSISPEEFSRHQQSHRQQR